MSVFSQGNILPFYPGLAMGNVIHRNDLMLPIVEKKYEEFESQIGRLRAEKEKLQATLPKVCENSVEQEIQRKVNSLTREIFRLDKDLGPLSDELKLLETAARHLAIQETLPIDFHKSIMKIDHRSFYSERMNHLILSDKNSLVERIQSFVTQFFSKDTYFDTDNLYNMIRCVDNTLETECRACVVASFITLTRVRYLDPIVIRKNAELSDNLKKKASEYYVLTETVLGAVFLGVGKFYAESEKEKPSENTSALMSRLAMVSFISQGAIPKVGKNAEDINLWNLYADWKVRIEKDQNCGFPIGYKYRPLQEILQENKIIFDQLNKEKDKEK